MIFSKPKAYNRLLYIKVLGFSLLQLVLYSIFTFTNISGSCVSCPDEDGNYILPFLIDNSTGGQQFNDNVYSNIILLERNIRLDNFERLDLDVERNTSTFVLERKDNSGNDTIYCKYRTQVEYLDGNCGMQFKISGMEITSTFSKQNVIKKDEKLNTWEIEFYK